MLAYALMHVYASTSLCTHLLMRRYAPAALCTRYALRPYPNLCTFMHPPPYAHTCLCAAMHLCMFMHPPPYAHTCLCAAMHPLLYAALCTETISQLLHVYASVSLCTHLLTDKGPCSQFDYNVVECTHKIPPPPLEGHVERPFPPPMCIDHLVFR
jgi:hypothetical protein